MPRVAPVLSPFSIGFAIQLAGVLGYLLVEQVVAAAWPSPGYSFQDNFVSDLGVPLCTQTDRWVCSPLHQVMNTTFQLVGCAVLLGSIAFASTFRGVRRVVTTILGCVQALGLVLVGVAPGSFAEDITNDPTQMALHSVGALLSILGTSLHALVQGAWSWRRARRFATSSLLLGAATPLILLIAEVTGVDNLGMGAGAFERVGVYAAFAWLGLVGTVGLLRPQRFSAS